MRDYKSKILNLEEMLIEREKLNAAGVKLVFTNGCFDILHPGHVDYLFFARSQGDALVVGLNSDRSVKENKGEQRPLVSEQDRAKVLAGLEAIDYIVIFDEKEPESVIAQILPDILVKGEDWGHFVSGREAVEANGGKVVLAPLVEGKSTTNIVEKIQQQKADE